VLDLTIDQLHLQIDAAAGQAHLAHAARSEYTKIDKPLNEADLSGWK
jgi:hypothetical protein